MKMINNINNTNNHHHHNTLNTNKKITSKIPTTIYKHILKILILVVITITKYTHIHNKI